MTSKLRHNKFSDWSKEEWDKYNNYKPIDIPNVEYAKAWDCVDIPTAIDWRDLGAVNPVQD